MLKTIANIIFGLMIFVGIMMIAGSANDCDGACMENANTIGEMITISLMGLALTIVGGFGFAKTN